MSIYFQLQYLEVTSPFFCLKAKQLLETTSQKLNLLLLEDYR